MRPGAIVIGGHFQGLGAVRALATQGVKVVVIDSEHCISRFSRYCSRFYKSPEVTDGPRFFKFLKSLAQIPGIKGSVIFPTDDETVYFLSKYHSRLSEFYRLITPKWDVVKYFYNKKLSYTLAEKTGIHIPKSIFPESVDDISNCDLRFPVIIKPAVMRPFFKATGKKVFKASNISELIKTYKLALKVISKDEIIVQEIIPDASKNLFSFCPVMNNGEVIAAVTAQRLRQHPMDFGRATTYAVTKRVPELEISGAEILNAVSYNSIAEVEFIYDSRDNTYKFLEVNPRIWGWHSIAGAAGVNLPYIAYKNAVGTEDIKSPVFLENKKWIRLMTDLPTSIKALLKKQVTGKEIWESYIGKKEFAVFSFYDPLPFAVEIFLIPYLISRRGI